MKNIVLIGMPGSGKSTVGVLLAKAAAMQFVDTDIIIQQKTGRRLQDIIDKEGIDFFLYFAKAEERAILSLDIKGTVIATGGSVVYSDKAMEHLKSIGTAVFLDVPLCELKRRIDNITTRGIALKKGEPLDMLYNERLPLYKKYADITVSSADTEETVKRILIQL